MKVCFKCGKSKDLSEFYKHKDMADGHLGKCKQCTKDDSSARRNAKIDEVREYDRARGSRQSKDYLPAYRAKYPNKYKTHNLVSNCIRDKKLFAKPCEICGCTKSVAHHDNYLLPLSVRWLCQAHHKQWHAEHGEAKNP